MSERSERIMVARRALPVLLALAAAPFVLDAYQLSTAGRMLAFAVLALSVDLLTGVTGLPTLGQAAYFGVGAYAAALTGVHLTANGPVQLLIATAAGAVAAAATGWVAVRTSGTVFLMLTLAVGELVRQVADHWSYVGASNGLAGMPAMRLTPGGSAVAVPGYLYWYLLSAFVVVYLVVRLLVASPFGRTLRGIRDNEPRMRALGYRPAVAKFAVYACAGAVAGAGGAMWVTQTRFVSPADLGFEVAALALLAVVIGGAGTLWGPCLGAAIVLLTRDYLPSVIGGNGPLLLGVLFILTVYLLPRGVGGLARRPAAVTP
jgi:branched-chain amino acid transport system permease protein